MVLGKRSKARRVPRRVVQERPNAGENASLRGLFIKRLAGMSRRLGVRIVQHPDVDPPQVTLEFSRGFPMWLRIELVSDSTVALVGIVRAFADIRHDAQTASVD